MELTVNSYLLPTSKSDFQGLVTLTLDRVILHTVVHHSSTSTYISHFIEIKQNFLWTDIHTIGSPWMW